MFKISNRTSAIVLKVIISLIIMTLVRLSIPWNLEKYWIKEISSKSIAPISFACYEDLDGDNLSERIERTIQTGTRTSILITRDSAVIGQWAIYGYPELSYPPLTFVDTDFDGKKECLYFTRLNDSVRVHIVYPNMKINPLTISFEYIEPRIDKQNQVIIPVGSIPPSGKSDPQLLIAINGAYYPEPRSFYSINLKTQKVKKSPKCYANIIAPFLYHYVPADQYYISSGMGAFGNSDSLNVYSDKYLWFYVLNQNLDFVFPPLRIGEYSSISTVIPIESNDQLLWAVVSQHQGPNEGISNVALYNNDGVLQRMHVLNKTARLKTSELYTWDYINQELCIFQPNGDLITYNLNLTPKVKKQVLIDIDPGTRQQIDIKNDGNLESIFLNVSGTSLWFYDNHNKRQNRIPVSINDGNFRVYPYHSKDKTDQFFVYTSKMEYIFQRKLNPWRIFIPLILVFSGILIYLVVELIIRNQLRIENHRRQVEEDLIQMQYVGILRQIEPHFTFNVLNNVRSFYESSEPEKANTLITKYTQLLRQSLIRRSDILVSLADELEFVSNYLIVEKIRKPNLFDYEIQCPESLHEIQIPRTLIFTLVENAVKHAFPDLPYTGMINIEVQKINGNNINQGKKKSAMKKNQVEILVSDNGIGLTKSKSPKYESSHTGLNLIRDMLDLVEKKYHSKIDFEISSLQPTGTMARFLLKY